MLSLSNAWGFAQEHTLHPFADKILRQYVKNLIDDIREQSASQHGSFSSSQQSTDHVYQLLEEEVLEELLTGRSGGYHSPDGDTHIYSSKIGSNTIVLDVAVYGYRQEFEENPEKHFLPVEMSNSIKAWVLAERYKACQGTMPTYSAPIKWEEFIKFEPHRPRDRNWYMRSRIYVNMTAALSIVKEECGRAQQENQKREPSPQRSSL